MSFAIGGAIYIVKNRN
ncbi:MAG: QVPTGV class sortase B protein-sorting domain-containing protein [Pseudanabaena sp. RU_4_16]|nr:QVPTGV class sortase B protein-sorting domain-containing protein [Pseudanabaena sp. RU_4_16]